MDRKLKPGCDVVANGRTYKDSVPESAIKTLGLKDKFFEPVENKTDKPIKKIS